MAVWDIKTLCSVGTNGGMLKRTSRFRATTQRKRKRSTFTVEQKIGSCSQKLHTVEPWQSRPGSLI